MPAHLINGAEVAIGVAIVHAVFSGLAGVQAAQLAIIGAVCASLADRPNTVDRIWKRELAAGLSGVAATAMVALLHTQPWALAVGIALLSFAGMLTLAWGPRASAISFAPILGIVFAMGIFARDLPADMQRSPLASAGLALAGALVYVIWSVIANTSLQGRFRSLALANAMAATAGLLRTRATMHMAQRHDQAGIRALTALIGDEASLAEHLQLARDMLFAAPKGPHSRRQTAILLQVIELRDLLLASRLDLDQMGEDPVAMQVRVRIATDLERMASEIDRAVATLHGAPAPAAPGKNEPTSQPPVGIFDGLALAGEPRERFLPLLVARLQHLHESIAEIQALLRRTDTTLPLSRKALSAFVAPEGWPIAILQAQFRRDSPVLRHALRTGFALGAAYLIALLLPWNSHPQWLVLSVAVVLRGTLDQTLSRRNMRVLGTVIGCLLVVGFINLRSPTASNIVFLSATGVAHAFALQWYLVTAIAATTMALLQAHIADPSHGFAIGERLADTALGAVLAWGASYVLPSWERRRLAPAIERTLDALRDYGQKALSVDARAAVSQRLARRRAYDALTALGASLQRGQVEPANVRPPVAELAALLDACQRLMAHLSAIRLTLLRRGKLLDQPGAAVALREADLQLATLLDSGRIKEPEDIDQPIVRAAESLPARPLEEDLLAWVERRLRVTIEEAREVRREARRTLDRLAESKRD